MENDPNVSDNPANDALVPPSIPIDQPGPLPNFTDNELADFSAQQLKLLDNPDKTIAPKDGGQADATQAARPILPSLFERTQLNLRHSFWTSPLSGQILYTGLRKLADVDVEWAATYKKWLDTELLKYDLMPDSQTAGEYASAILGGFLGGVPDPSNLVALGTGTAATVLGRTVQAGAKVGALSQALDAPRQVMMQWNGLQAEWDWRQTALAFPTGFLMGSGIHLAGSEAPAALLHALRSTTDAAGDDAARIVASGNGLPTGDAPKAAFIDEWRPTTQAVEFGQGIKNVSRETLPTVEATPAGAQTVLPGAERAGQGVMAQRGADAALRGKVPQKGADTGLFSDQSKQVDLADLLAAAPPKKAETPQTLTQFLRSRGGLKNDPELEALYGKRKLDLVRKKGMTLDQAREAAVEAGYLPPDAPDQPPTSTIGHLLDALAAEDKGQPTFPMGAQAPAGRDMHMDAAHSEVAATFQDLGIERKAQPDIFRRALELVYTKGLSGDDAVERASMEIGHYAGATPKASRAISNSVMDQLAEGDVFFMRARPAQTPGMPMPHVGERYATRPGAGIAQPGTQQQIAGASTSVPTTPAPPSLPPQGVAVRNIITQLADDLDVTLRQGHVKPGALGQYDMRQMVARARSTDEVETVSHEIGHHIDALLGKPLRDVIRKHEAEVRDMVLPAYANSIDRVWKQEGFAEFARAYVTNRNWALSKAPNFAADFRSFMEAENPGVLAALDKAHLAWETFINAPSGAVTRDFVVTWAPPTRPQLNEGLRASINVRLHDMYAATIDSLHPIDRLQRNLVKMISEKTGDLVDLPAERDATALMRVALHPFPIAARDIADGVRGYHSTAVQSSGLKDIITLATGRPNVWGKWDDVAVKDFSTFLVAREADFRFAQYARGELQNPPTGFVTRGDWQTSLAELRAKYPTFDQAATMFDGFRQAMWKLRFDSGQIGKDVYEAGLNNPHHVPFWRDLSEDPTLAARLGLGKPSLESAAVKRFRGSNRPILDPIQSTVKEIADLRAWVAMNDTVKALKNLASQAERRGKEPAQAAASGKIVEVIPNTQIKAGNKFTLEQALEMAAKEQGIDGATLAAAKSELSQFMSTDTALQLFTHAPVKTGREPIIFGWEGGERFALRLNDVENSRDVFRLLSTANETQRDLGLRIAGMASQIMRAGTVTDPTFTIGNVTRDTAMAWVLHGGVPLKPTASGFMHYWRNDEIAQLYEAAGGQAGGVMTQQLRDLRLTREFQRMAQNGRLVSRFTSFRALWENITKVAEVSETATRLGVFEKYYTRNLAMGLDKYSAAFRAMTEAVDTLDFSRHGSRFQTVTALVPFLNANVQGLDKLTRSTLVPWAKKMNGDILTRQESNLVQRSTGVMVRIGLLSAASVALRALYADDPEYEEISDYLRATHWMVKVPWLNGGKVINALGQEVEVPAKATGVWVAIPKPFEAAIIPNAAERAFEAIMLKDPSAAKRWAMGALTITAPPNPLTDIPLVKNVIETKLGKDLFTGQPIVPDYLKGLVPEQQYTPRTPELAKAVTKVLNKVWPAKDWSPLEVEHVIVGFTSTWGRDLMALFDVAAGKEKGWQDWPMFRRYMREVTRGSVSSLAFWDLVSQSTGRLEQAATTYKLFLDGHKDTEARDFFAHLDAGQRAYVALKIGENFTADDKRLHPIIRAHEAMNVVTNMRRQVADNNIVSEFADQETLKLTGSQQKMLDQELAMLSMLEARNALIASQEPGWQQKRAVDPGPTYDVIREISPEAADELAARFASHKVYRYDAVQRAWPEVLSRLRSEGTATPLSDLRADVKASGYEMGAYRQRKAKLPRASFTGEDLTRVP